MARTSQWLQLDERGDGSALVRWAPIPLRLIVGYGFACLATLVVGGSGPLAIDGWRRRRSI